MERVYLGDIRNHLNEEVLVQGFVENFRNSRAMAFIVLKDITGKLQITIEKEKLPEVAAAIEGLTGDSVISVVGTAFESEYVKLNGLEMFPKEIRIESLAAALPSSVWYLTMRWSSAVSQISKTSLMKGISS